MAGIFNFTVRCNVKQTLIEAPSETSCFRFGNYIATLLLVAIRIFIYTKEIFSPTVKIGKLCALYEARERWPIVIN